MTQNKTLREKLVALQPNMLNFALMLTSNRADAYDLLQDTTLKVLDKNDLYVENVNFKGWVFTIMRNLFINDYRRKKRSATFHDETEDVHVLNNATDNVLIHPEGAMHADEITDAIHALDDDMRVPFEMMVQGYKYVEIAERMNLPLGTVKSRIFFARKRLMENLADYRV